MLELGKIEHGAEKHIERRNTRIHMFCAGTPSVPQGSAVAERLTWTCTLGVMQGRRTPEGCPGSPRRSSSLGGRPSFGPRSLRFNSHAEEGSLDRGQENAPPTGSSCVNVGRSLQSRGSGGQRFSSTTPTEQEVGGREPSLTLT